MRKFKLIVKWFFLSILVFAFLFFFYSRTAVQNELGPNSSKWTIEDNINNQIYRVAKEYGGLSISGFGGLTDILLDKIRDKTYYFDAKEELTLEKGREYLVKLVLDILKIYNEDDLIRKHLFSYPFGTKNINLAIFSKEGKAEDRNLPKITGVSFRLNHLRLEYLAKITGKPQGHVYYNNPEYEEKEIKEGFRAALHQVKSTLSIEQLKTATILGLLDGNLTDEETSADREYQSEIITKELWELCYRKLLRDGIIPQEHFDTDVSEIKKSKLSPWEKDITFPDEKAKVLYQKKAEYLKGEKEWEN